MMIMDHNPYSIRRFHDFFDIWQVFHSGVHVATVEPYNKQWSVVMEKDKPAFWLKPDRESALEMAVRSHSNSQKGRKVQEVKIATMFKQQVTYTFFDTETTGLPKDWKAPMTQLDNWPRIIELAWATYNADGELLNTHECLIKPDGWTVPKEKFWIDHGFSTEKCEAEGIPMLTACNQVLQDINETKFLIAHNISYDYNVLGAEMIRYGARGKNRPERLCTKELSTDYCAIPHANGRGFKWPTLTELHVKLFGREFEGAHGAAADMVALGNCFFELKKRGVITK